MRCKLLRTVPSTRQHDLFCRICGAQSSTWVVIGFVVRNGFRLCSVWRFSVKCAAHGAREARRGVCDSVWVLVWFVGVCGG